MGHSDQQLKIYLRDVKGDRLQLPMQVEYPEGHALVVADHTMQGLIRLIDRAVVVHFGRLLAEGSPEAVAADPRGQAVYRAGNDEPAVAPGPSETDGPGGDAP